MQSLLRGHVFCFPQNRRFAYENITRMKNLQELLASWCGARPLSCKYPVVKWFIECETDGLSQAWEARRNVFDVKFHIETAGFVVAYLSLR
jgi:hypothetical protein